jgi:hypothetical protein
MASRIVMIMLPHMRMENYKDNEDWYPFLFWRLSPRKDMFRR